MSEKEIQQQMDAMRALDEPMPQVGIFWFDPEDHSFFGVRKQEFALPYFEFVYDEHWDLSTEVSEIIQNNTNWVNPTPPKHTI